MASHQRLVESLRSLLSWIVQRWQLAPVLIALLLNLAAEGPPPASFDTRANRILAGERFDFAGWEVKALLGKLSHSLITPQRYMDEPARHDFFLDYLELVADIQRFEQEIHRIYTDPEVRQAAESFFDQHIAKDVASGSLLASLHMRLMREMRAFVSRHGAQDRQAGLGDVQARQIEKLVREIPLEEMPQSN